MFASGFETKVENKILLVCEDRFLILKNYCRNILLKRNSIKIANFDETKLVAKAKNSKIGSPSYWAPEIWLENKYSFKSDIW